MQCGLCVCVCVSDTVVICAKTAELIEMSFGRQTRVGYENHVSDGNGDPAT